MNFSEIPCHLPRFQLNLIIKELKRENSSLKTDLNECKFLLSDYQKYFNYFNEMNEKITSNEEVLRLINRLRAHRDVKQIERPVSPKRWTENELRGSKLSYIREELNEEYVSDEESDEEIKEINVLKRTEKYDSVSTNKLNDNCLKQTNVRELRVRKSVQQIDPQTEDEMTDEEEKRDGSKGKYVCDFEGCSAVLNSANSLYTHRYIHTDMFLCGIKGCQYRAGKPSHLAEHKMAEHKSSKEVAKTHKNRIFSQMNKNRRKFVCTVSGCEFRHQTVYGLKRHKFQKHSNERPFECSVEDCDKRFKTGVDYRRHLKRVHKKGVNLTNNLNTKRNVKQKEVIISSDNSSKGRLYECPLEDCKRRFNQRPNLRRHLRGVHKMTTNRIDSLLGFNQIPGPSNRGSGKYVCPHEECKSRFNQSSNLRRHLKGVHKMTTNRIDSLLLLFKQTRGPINRGFGKYVCPHEDCKRRFTQRCNLRRHLNGVHKMTTNQINDIMEYRVLSYKNRGSGKYVCPHEECERGFNQRTNLRRHLRGVHKMSEIQINEIMRQISEQLSDNNNTKRQLKTKEPEEGVHQLNNFSFQYITQSADLSNTYHDLVKNEDFLTESKIIDHNLSGIKCKTDYNSIESLDEQMESVLDQTNIECIEEMATEDIESDKHQEFIE